MMLAAATAMGFRQGTKVPEVHNYPTPTTEVFRARSRSGSRQPGSANPAGAKLLRRWAKHKLGMRCTYEQARDWYVKRPT